MRLSSLRICEHLGHSYLGPEAPTGIQQHELHSKKETVCCAENANGLVGLYYLNIERVKEDDYYQMRDTYVLSKAQEFPHNASFQPDGALS